MIVSGCSTFWLFHVVYPKMLPTGNASEQPVGNMVSVEQPGGFSPGGSIGSVL